MPASSITIELAATDVELKPGPIYRPGQMVAKIETRRADLLSILIEQFSPAEIDAALGREDLEIPTPPVAVPSIVQLTH